MPPTSEKQEVAVVVARLRQHLEQLRNIERFVNPRAEPLNSAERKEAQGLLRLVKEELKADRKRLSAADRRGEITPAEGASLFPAVHEALARLKVRWNSRPETWGSDLFDAIVQVESQLNQLEGLKRGPRPARGKSVKR